MPTLTPEQRNQIAQAAVEKIDELIGCWHGSKKAGAALEVGQIVYAPVADVELRPRVADVLRADPFRHDRAELHIRTVDDKTDFRQKAGRLPLAALKLGDTEELMLSKGKQRPCVILAKSGGIQPHELPEGAQRNMGQNAFRGVFFLAPIYSCSIGGKTTAFGPVMAARVKCMMYPEFLYAPKAATGIDCDSIVRLDRVFCSHLMFAVNPQSLFMSEEMLAIAWEQLRLLAGERPSDNYLELRELLMGELPAECR